jgi:hypothetical protein
MLTGKRFRMKTATMGIDTVDDKRAIGSLPDLAGPAARARFVDQTSGPLSCFCF